MFTCNFYITEIRKSLRVDILDFHVRFSGLLTLLSSSNILTPVGAQDLALLSLKNKDPLVVHRRCNRSMLLYVEELLFTVESR